MFQVLSTRKRKDADASEIKVQVAVFGFDLLYLNGEALVRQSFRDRRDKLKAHFKEVEGEFLFAKSADPDTMEHVQELLEDSVKGKKELIFCLLCNLPSVSVWFWIFLNLRGFFYSQFYHAFKINLKNHKVFKIFKSHNYREDEFLLLTFSHWMTFCIS